MHLIMYIPQGQAITKVLSNAKRFMAYEIVKRLKKLNEVRVLAVLKDGVNSHDQKNGKVHQVFEPSFDIKPCYSLDFIHQKLEYIHHNPVKGKWCLVEDFARFEHSSAAFYELDQPSEHITHIREVLEIIDL